jgi:hypothetical protein
VAVLCVIWRANACICHATIVILEDKIKLKHNKVWIFRGKIRLQEFIYAGDLHCKFLACSDYLGLGNNVRVGCQAKAG